MSRILAIILIVYINILSIKCKEKSSLTFVIDDTTSMCNVIEKVKEDAVEIMKSFQRSKASEIEDIVLVTFNDPDFDFKIRTNSSIELKKALRGIRVHDTTANNDCPEYSMSGIKKALLESRTGSYLYVFTDALAKDAYLINDVTYLCQQKQSQVMFIFVINGACGNTYALNHLDDYYKVAKACSGHVFPVGDQGVKEILFYIDEIVGHYASTMIMWKTISFFELNTPISFELDDKIQEAIVTVSASRRVDITVRQYYGHFYYTPVDVVEIVRTNNVKVVKIVNKVPGPYTLFISGTSTVVVAIYAKTDFTFTYGFSPEVPTSIKDTITIPARGQNYYLSIYVNDPDQLISIEEVQIMHVRTEDVAMTYPLRKIGEHSYVTNKFYPPNHFMFKIAVKGTIKKTGKTIIRISKTAIEPPTEELKVPEVTINEGSQLAVNYNDDIALKCKVFAFPKPDITWLASDGTKLESTKTITVQPPFDYVSNLKLTNMKRANTYTCIANNDVGIHSGTVHVTVNSPFEKNHRFPAAIPVKFGYQETLTCGIKCKVPCQAAWQLPTYLNNSKVTIHSDENQITINYMDFDLQGQYRCKVWLPSDPSVSEEQTMTLFIKDLARPKVTTPVNEINVLETADGTIYCRIKQGVPRPTLTWHFKKTGDNSEWQSLSEGQEELVIRSVTLDHAGTYKCIASNKVGKDTITAELKVLKAPEVYSNQSQITAQYGSNQELECTIVAHPPPTVTWTDDQGHELFTEIAKGNKFTSRLNVTNLRKDGNYFCNAVNNIDEAKIGIKILVEPPLVIGSQFDAITKVPYGKEVKLKCDISSKFPIQRQWILSRSKELHKTNDRFTISPDGTELTIHSMEIDLQGTYTCKVWLKSDRGVYEKQTTKIVIHDLDSPEIISLNDFWDKNTFTAVCSVKGNPKPSITWQYAKERDGHYNNLNTTGDKLVIESIESRHSGFYKCIAANEIGNVDKILEVIVEESPKITNNKTVYIGVVGDKELVIPCNVTGTPAPTITWKNNNNQIISTDNDSKYHIKNNVLYILNPTIKDSDKFTCVAENTKGITEKTFGASITDNLEKEPSLYGEIQKIYLLLDESKDLNCTTPGKPEEIKWYKDGLLTDTIGVNYQIKKASILHDGKYTCRVNSVSQTYLVDVGYKPTFTNKYKTYNWFGGRDEYIDCFVESKPEANIEWTYNNQKKNSQLFDYIVEGWGEYKCRVSNVHGTIEKTIVVTTEGCLISRRFDYKKNTPLITSINLDVDYDDPLITGSELMFIKAGQRLGISCHTAGKNNNFKALPEKDYLKIECLQEDLFTVNDNVYKYADLICNEAVVPTFINTGTKCVNPTGEIIEVEFKADVPTESYKVCYDKKLNVPLFASSELSSYNIGNEVDSYRWTPMTGFSGGITVEACNETSKCCYKRSQLVNALDVTAGPPQAATFNEINAVTVWQPCKDEERISWQTLEGNVRSLLQNKTEINVWSGASEYETQNIGLVPRYLWKVLEINDNLTVIVHVNAEIPTKADIKCTKTIKDSKYANQLLRSGDQYTYLCNSEEFSTIFGIPLDTFY